MNHYLCLNLNGSIIARILGSVALLFLLVGCANGIAPNSSEGLLHTSTLSPTLTPTLDTPEVLFTQNPSNQATVGGILTVALSDTGETLSCRNLVLATNRLTYSNGEIQHMASHFKQGAANPPELDPTLFAHVQGNFVNDIPNWGMNFFPGCWGVWEITNISQEPVQIVRINMQLTADPQPDSYQYHFIDVCSLPYPDPTTSPCFERGGGVPMFNYILHLGQTNASAVFQGQVVSAEPTLPPGQTIEAGVDILPVDPNSSFIYTLTPELVLNTPTGSGQVFNLTQWTSTIALVNVNQFTCYQLRGNTFVPLTPIFAGPTVSSTECQ